MSASVPAINAEPPNICAYKNPPSFLWIRIPAIGGPVTQATEMNEKAMPVLVPIFFMSDVRLAQHAGKRLWMPEPKKPYITTKAYREPSEETAAQQ